MIVCTKHKSVKSIDLITLLKKLRCAGTCPCCGFKYHTSKNSYFSSETPPQSWSRHETCCNITGETDFIKNYYNAPEDANEIKLVYNNKHKKTQSIDYNYNQYYYIWPFGTYY